MGGGSWKEAERNFLYRKVRHIKTVAAERESQGFLSLMGAMTAA